MTLCWRTPCFASSSTGLCTFYGIPVSYFFTKGLNGSQMLKLLVYAFGKVEETGFKIARIVTDNHKVSVSAMKELCGGFLTYRIQHPCNPERLLFLSYDYCHIIQEYSVPISFTRLWQGWGGISYIPQKALRNAEILACQASAAY